MRRKILRGRKAFRAKRVFGDKCNILIFIFIEQRNIILQYYVRYHAITMWIIITAESPNKKKWIFLGNIPKGRWRGTGSRWEGSSRVDTIHDKSR